MICPTFSSAVARSSAVAPAPKLSRTSLPWARPRRSGLTRAPPSPRTRLKCATDCATNSKLNSHLAELPPSMAPSPPTLLARSQTSSPLPSRVSMPLPSLLASLTRSPLAPAPPATLAPLPSPPSSAPSKSPNSVPSAPSASLLAATPRPPRSTALPTSSPEPSSTPEHARAPTRSVLRGHSFALAFSPFAQGARPDRSLGLCLIIVSGLIPRIAPRAPWSLTEMTRSLSTGTTFC